jgi:hypothetical protein
VDATGTSSAIGINMSNALTIREIPTQAPPARESGIFAKQKGAHADLDALDLVVRESIAYRAVGRAALERSPSPLDAVAMSVARARYALLLAVSHLDEDSLPPAMARRLGVAIACGYRFCIELASELCSIEALELDPDGERSEVSAFVPFALLSFDEVLLPALLYICEGDYPETEPCNAVLADVTTIQIALTRVVSSLLSVA